MLLLNPPCRGTGRWCGERENPPASHLVSLSFRPRVSRPKTRIHVRLLGPCFKTGRNLSFRQRSARREEPAPSGQWRTSLVLPRGRPPQPCESSSPPACRLDGNPAVSRDSRRRPAGTCKSRATRESRTGTLNPPSCASEKSHAGTFRAA